LDERRGRYANIPFHLTPIIRSTLLTGVFGFLAAVVYPTYPISGILTEDFASQSFLAKFKYVIVCSYCLRARYHFGWHWIQISNITTGIAWAGEGKWDAI